MWFVLHSEPAADEAPASKEEESGAGPTTSSGSSGTPDDLIAWFNTTVKEYDSLFLIYYRGLW